MQKYPPKRHWKLPVPQRPWQHLSRKKQWHFYHSTPQWYNPCFSFGLHLLLTLLLCPPQLLAACCTKAEHLLVRKRQLQSILQKDFKKDHTALQTLLRKAFHVWESMRGNREVTDHLVKAAKQNWVSSTQRKVSAEMEITALAMSNFWLRKGN